MIIRSNMLHAVGGFRETIGRMMLAFYGGNRTNCFYINGSDVLPPPLTREEEAEILKRYETD